ncbi:ATP-grasp domain-containing protein [Cytobacillus oceanisediminis]|uniref:ATP-grasp domain-containing protein n=1 Tax=Cytobacillus oceanisediminis TaxID=665099 RepID=UPI002079D6A2|nr:ATP-grasp domain-containing protein [Cytobacillus oceanisediminis]USK44117.1 ATP-grasp domain-containing protein [Cytobacillus oceanisediminis]
MFDVRNLTKKKKRAWLYNISDEQSLNSMILPNIVDKEANHLMQYQEQQMLFLAAKEDLVIFKNSIEGDYLEYLNQWINKSVIIYNEQYHTHPMEEYDIVPFIHCGEAASLNQNTFGVEPEIGLLFNDKLYTRKFSEEHGFNITPGKICKKMKEVEDFYNVLEPQSIVVLKTSYGSSAKGIKVLKSDIEFKRFMKVLKRRNQENCNLAIEKWLENSTTINCSMIIDENIVEIINITQQLISENTGKYIGTNYTPNFEEDILLNYKNEMFKLGNILQRFGYKGVLGVDSIIHENKLYPIIEINARFTQVIYLNNLVENLKVDYNANSIVTSYRNFKLKNDCSFSLIKEYLDKKLNPDDKSGYIIYTFGKIQGEQYTSYRVYVLFYGDNSEKVKELLDIFNNIELKIGEE